MLTTKTLMEKPPFVPRSNVLSTRPAMPGRRNEKNIRNDKDMVRLLLNKGADHHVKDKNGVSPWEIARLRASVKIQQELFNHRSLQEGPSIKPAMRKPAWKKPSPPTSKNMLKACKESSASLMEFYLAEDKEKRVTEPTSVYELLYGKGPGAILDDARVAAVKDPLMFNWYHLSENNVR